MKYNENKIIGYGLRIGAFDPMEANELSRKYLGKDYEKDGIMNLLFAIYHQIKKWDKWPIKRKLGQLAARCENLRLHADLVELMENRLGEYDSEMAMANLQTDIDLW